ncbi:hypothetical protein [Streptomyces sp. PSKA30]|uniref:hypothetical protein n=1 Tax=Streptomyces sp. PSKA30 TaxID=2874597 RepID=UPI001CD0C5DC|nr:hypothetical protein [Streptomyces sp. PSKA30]MBZ9643122.1 hypothetical protein [Streptomyces sp. PSKA30]
MTELRADTGVLKVTDAFLLESGAHLEEDAPAGRGELVQHAKVTQGTVDLTVSVRPRGGAEPERQVERWLLACPQQPLKLHLTASRPLPYHPCTLPLREGEDLWVHLRWSQGQDPYSGQTVASSINDTLVLDSAFGGYSCW